MARHQLRKLSENPQILSGPLLFLLKIVFGGGGPNSMGWSFQSRSTNTPVDFSMALAFLRTFRWSSKSWRSIPKKTMSAPPSHSTVSSPVPVTGISWSSCSSFDWIASWFMASSLISKAYSCPRAPTICAAGIEKNPSPHPISINVIPGVSPASE